MSNAHTAPMPFNPLADANASARYAAVTGSMEADGFYADHTREECKAEWRVRYDHLLATTIPFASAQDKYLAEQRQELDDMAHQSYEDMLEMDDGA